MNKDEDKDWFHIECNKIGTRWTGTCWYYYEQIRYEFQLEFEIPVTYPTAAPELKLPELDGLTSKMYRGGKICQTVHFQPLWAKNVPKFGIAHSLALSVCINFLCLMRLQYDNIMSNETIHFYADLNIVINLLNFRLIAQQLGPWLAAEIPDLVGRGVIEKFKK